MGHPPSPPSPPAGPQNLLSTLQSNDYMNMKGLHIIKNHLEQHNEPTTEKYVPKDNTISAGLPNKTVTKSALTQ